MNAIQAIKKALNVSGKIEIFEGYINIEGVRLPVSFQAPVGATVAEKDAAFLASLAQQAEINYLSIGTVDAIYIGTVVANKNESTA